MWRVVTLRRPAERLPLDHVSHARAKLDNSVNHSPRKRSLHMNEARDPIAGCHSECVLAIG